MLHTCSNAAEQFLFFYFTILGRGGYSYNPLRFVVCWLQTNKGERSELEIKGGGYLYCLFLLLNLPILLIYAQPKNLSSSSVNSK